MQATGDRRDAVHLIVCRVVDNLHGESCFDIAPDVHELPTVLPKDPTLRPIRSPSPYRYRPNPDSVRQAQQAQQAIAWFDPTQLDPAYLRSRWQHDWPSGVSSALDPLQQPLANWS
jgi:hypothetical protein